MRPSVSGASRWSVLATKPSVPSVNTVPWSPKTGWWHVAWKPSGKIAQALFPLGFQATCHQPVFGLHGTVLTLGTLGFVASTLHREAPLTEGRIVVRFDLLYGKLCGFQRRRC